MYDAYKREDTQVSSTELTPATSGIVIHATGEVVGLDDTAGLERVAREHPDVLAAYIAYLDDAKRDLDGLRSDLGAFLIARMDADATQTLHTDTATITVNGSSDTVEEYDAEKLHGALLGLVSEGVLSEAAVEKAIRTKREVSKSGINSLRALHKAEVDAAIDHATSERTRPRRITVKR